MYDKTDFFNRTVHYVCPPYLDTKMAEESIKKILKKGYKSINNKN